MVADIEAGRVNCVITKDLSRLGRNYIESGSYIEIFFPRHGVRYIAISDGVDSLNKQEMDITPFRNILNDLYAKDLSKKQRAFRNSKYLKRGICCGLRTLRLNRIIGMVKISEDRVRREILKSKNQSGSPVTETAAKKLAKNDKRLSEIERIYAKLYEDRALEVVSDENFKMLSVKLQAEQKQLRADSDWLRESMAEKEKSAEDVVNYIEVIKSMEQINTVLRYSKRIRI